MSDINEALDEIDSTLRVTLRHMSPDQPNIRKGLIEAIGKGRTIRRALEQQREEIEALSRLNRGLDEKLAALEPNNGD